MASRACKYTLEGKRRYTEDAEDLESELRERGYAVEVVEFRSRSKRDKRSGLPLITGFEVYAKKCR